MKFDYRLTDDERFYGVHLLGVRRRSADAAGARFRLAGRAHLCVVSARNDGKTEGRRRTVDVPVLARGGVDEAAAACDARIRLSRPRRRRLEIRVGDSR